MTIGNGLMLPKGGMLWCSRCQEFKPLAYFRDSVLKHKCGRYCIACHSAINHHPDKMAKQRNRMRKNNYGITNRDYDLALKKQNYRCAICQSAKPASWNNGHKSEYFVVDHDHRTGIVRGLLCPSCNTAIGLIHENVPRLHRMARYLRENQRTAVAVTLPMFEERNEP